MHMYKKGLEVCESTKYKTTLKEEKEHHEVGGQAKSFIANYLRRRRGSCLKPGEKARIGAGPVNCGPGRPTLPPPSKGGGPPCSRNIRIATSGGAGTKGPNGLQSQQYTSCH